MALLEQPFIEDSSISVDEYARQVAGKIENMAVYYRHACHKTAL